MFCGVLFAVFIFFILSVTFEVFYCDILIYVKWKRIYAVCVKCSSYRHLSLPYMNFTSLYFHMNSSSWD